MNKEEVAQAQKVIDSVRNGEPVGEPLKAVFPETSAPAPYLRCSNCAARLCEDCAEDDGKRGCCSMKDWKAEAERLRKALEHYIHCPHAELHCPCTETAKIALCRTGGPQK